MSNLINSFLFAVATLTTWSPTDKDGAITLSGGNLIADATGTGKVRGTSSKTSGKFYIEYLINSTGAGTFLILGFREPSVPIANSMVGDTNRLDVQCDGNITHTGSSTSLGYSFAAADTVCIAVDFTANKIWVRKNSGSWHSGDPAAGTGGSTFTSGFTFAPAMQSSALSHNVTATFNSPFTYSVPSGFASWG